MRVGISANPHKPGAKATLEQLVTVLGAYGIEWVVEHETADLVGRDGVAARELAGCCDLIAVLGGDGTMMHAVAKLGVTDKPVAGINIGTLGFLTSCTDDELEELAEALKSGAYTTSRRTLLEARVLRAGSGEELSFLALNEAVLARGQTGRLVSLSARVDGELLNNYRADGLIVATPTGSTAYSLSAGGPLISPAAGVFVITPVCPHTLSQRSLVVDDERVVELSPDDPGDGPMLFTVDGRDCVEIFKQDRVEVRKASQSLDLLRLEGRSFYGALRQKLNWRGG